jgi:hypothetical protein
VGAISKGGDNLLRHVDRLDRRACASTDTNGRVPADGRDLALPHDDGLIGQGLRALANHAKPDLHFVLEPQLTPEVAHGAPKSLVPDYLADAGTGLPPDHVQP